jgi:hypothetical protein
MTARFLLLMLAVAQTSAAVPTVEELGGDWFNPMANASAHVPGALVDLPIISNFWGSVGSSPGNDAKGGIQGASAPHPVDLFSINALEMPPFAGCGALNTTNTTYGCGKLFVDGQHVETASMRYQADEVNRRSGVLSSGLTVTSKMRMLFEQHGVLWQLNFTNPTDGPVTPEITFELSAMVQQFSHVQWVQSLAFDPSKFDYTSFASSGLTGILSVGNEPATNIMRPAASLWAFVGAKPDKVDVASTVPTARFTSLTIPAKSTIAMRIVLAVGNKAADAKALALSTSSSTNTFDRSWHTTHAQWQARWANAFDPIPGDFNGLLPTLNLEDAAGPGSGSAVERVYYQSALSIISLLRTNLPLAAKHVYTTSQGNLEPFITGGVVIGGAVSYYWDEALSSLMLAFLDVSSIPHVQLRFVEPSFLLTALCVSLPVLSRIHEHLHYRHGWRRASLVRRTIGTRWIAHR